MRNEMLKKSQILDLEFSLSDNHSLKKERYHSLISTLNGHEEFILDDNGKIISSNLEVVAVTGYEEWEVIGKNISIFYSDAERLEKKPENDLDLTRKNRYCSINEIKYKKRNAPFWAFMEISLIKQDPLAIRCFRVTLKDATHVVLNKHKIKFIQDEYSGLFNNSFIGIFKFNLKEERILALNQKAEHILRVKPNDTSFRNFFFNPASFDELIRRLIKNQKVDNFEFQLNDSETNQRWINVSCNYFPEKNLVEGILLDESDRRREFQELQRIKSQLDNFLYHASHDLRSPLTTVMGLVNLLKLECPNQQVISYANLIDERVNHLDEILHDIVSVVYNSHEALDVSRLSFSDLVNSVVKEFCITQPEVSVTSDVSEAGNFFSDKVRVRTIIKSLVTNSVKQQVPDDFTLHVIIRVHADDLKCEISVQDNGVRLNEESIDSLFTEFYRASPSTLGSGLNLFIAKSMVDTLQGNIKVDLTRATRFTLTLPNLKKTK